MKRTNKFNGYQKALSHQLFEQCPKSVFAAIAVSYATLNNGDNLDKAEDSILREWWILYRNGIVPQKPPIPEPQTLSV